MVIKCPFYRFLWIQKLGQKNLFRLDKIYPYMKETYIFFTICCAVMNSPPAYCFRCAADRQTGPRAYHCWISTCLALGKKETMLVEIERFIAYEWTMPGKKTNIKAKHASFAFPGQVLFGWKNILKGRKYFSPSFGCPGRNQKKSGGGEILLSFHREGELKVFPCSGLKALKCVF